MGGTPEVFLVDQPLLSKAGKACSSLPIYIKNQSFSKSGGKWTGNHPTSTDSLSDCQCLCDVFDKKCNPMEHFASLYSQPGPSGSNTCWQTPTSKHSWCTNPIDGHFLLGQKLYMKIRSLFANPSTYSLQCRRTSGGGQTSKYHVSPGLRQCQLTIFPKTLLDHFSF